MANSLQENSDITNVEQVPDLRCLREARGITLNDISQATKISIKNLEAMEKGDFQCLPPPVYTRAYIKSYASFLGVDDRQILSRYEKNIAISAQVVEAEAEEVPEKGSYFSKKIILNASLVLILCVLGFFMYSYFNLQAPNIALDVFLPMTSRDKPVDEVKNSVVPAQPSIGVTADVGSGMEKQPLPTVGVPASVITAKSTEKSEEAKASVTVAPSVKPAILIIIAREKTWLRITEDQKKEYQLLMQPGERIERSALQYDIDIGNAGGVSVQFQGKIMQTLGRSGEVVHLHLP